MTQQQPSTEMEPMNAEQAALLIAGNTPPSAIIFNKPDTTEIARFTEEGFYYKGEFIDDAGEVHRLLKRALYEINGPWYLYCERLLQAVDSGNKDAEELVLCQIRTALSGKG